MADRAVVFDLGNVLVSIDYERALKRLRPLSRRQASDLLAAIAGSPHLTRFETGETDVLQFTSALSRELGVTAPHEEICSILCDMFAPDPEMTAAYEAIRANGLPTYIFSNTNALHFDFIRASYPVLSQCDGFFLSFELGVMKPAPGAYAHVEAGTGCSRSEILYVDDRLENVKAAAARGWRAIHHVSPRATVRELVSTGVL
jgi:2-haloacid dehalogenase